MREKISLNKSWLFHLGKLARPPKRMAKKAYAFGGLTSSLPEEKQARLQVSPGGTHFLKLIAQGDTEIGLRNLCGTDLESHLDDSWTQVDLPHDWKVALPYEDNPVNLMAGSKPDGVAYYRKRFAVTENVRLNKRVILHFEGVSRFADIWLNGAYLGHNNSGYNSFSFDVSEMLYYGDDGENTLLVKADTTVGSEGWWYEGAGIYKDVYLEIKPEIYLNEDEFYVYTKSLSADTAELGIELSVTNESSKSVKIAPQVSLSDQVITFDEQVVAPLATVGFSSELTLENPKIWSPEHPNLYQAKVEISGDNLSKSFGIRTFSYDKTGFYLNGQPYELHGVCEHQDFAGVGVALSKDIIDYKIKVMKEMGVNAYRSSHHFASKELLEACDKYGILVMNENRLPESSPWRLTDLEKMVKKSRMNPSIAFWSISNEELVGNTPFGARNAKRFAQLIKSLDYEHLLVSAELLSPEGYVDEDYLKYFDILGVNYPEAGVMGEGAEIIHHKYPDLPMMSTENASYFSTRGIYKDDGDNCQCNNFGSMYSMVLPGKRQPGDPGVGGTAHPEEVMQYLNEHPYMGGVFLWTAFDYFGEPSPFAYPGIGSQFGICDVNGFPKDYYYYYKAHWTDAPMVHVMPHWNQEGLEIDESGKTPVRVFSNADSVEVFINGVSQGKQEIADCQANYEVTYQAGELKVLAYKDDKIVAQDIKHTSGKVNDVLATEIYSGDDFVLFEISALDENDYAVPTACDDILVTSEKGTVVGLGNGNPADISDYNLCEISLFSGKALAIVAKDKDNQAAISLSLKSGK
ncbi:glycoside hydrolase family 2 TIM barrel-domain containing protein [Streptococcus equinus]|uniref:glycoside hydrolase family 2 TIM barrel-domain containing protein n=1 Tax=Streptococcus equinus TaxID=1335 RepID=UPI00237AC096|nr:glycoside hydrolase family 2 TIM barrel-domain containing protein [Streptococcus equinus]